MMRLSLETDTNVALQATGRLNELKVHHLKSEIVS